jgi:hypothetical protein
MDTKQYTRKPFPVSAVQVTLQNIEEVAEWCKGEIEYRDTKMMGTVTPLPIVKLKGQGDNRGKDFEAALGCWVVELKGSFRSYKPAQFEASFDELAQDGLSVLVDVPEKEAPQLPQIAEGFADAAIGGIYVDSESDLSPYHEAG